MRAFWRRLRISPAVPAGLGPSAPHHPDHERPGRAASELRTARPPRQVVVEPEPGTWAEPEWARDLAPTPLPSPILVSVPDPAAQEALEVSLRAEQALATLAAAVDLLQDRLDDLDQRVTAELAACVQAAEAAALDAAGAVTADDLAAVRTSTARVAGQLARLDIELRAELTSVAERGRPGATPTVAATLAAARMDRGATPRQRVVDLRAWTGPDPAALRPEPQAWAPTR